MLKYSLTATALLVVGLTACLDDGPVAPQCLDLTGEITADGDTMVVSSGLRFLETAEGTGAAAESCAGDVVVDYSLNLADGTFIEDGNPLEFTIGETNYLPAFEQGIIGMRVGGARRLIISPSLGYGSQDRIHPQTGEVVIPGGSTLIFDVELLSID